MPSWAKFLAAFLAKLIPSIFGTDKPSEVIVEETDTHDALRPSDSDVRSDIGLHDRTKNC